MDKRLDWRMCIVAAIAVVVGVFVNATAFDEFIDPIIHSGFSELLTPVGLENLNLFFGVAMDGVVSGVLSSFAGFAACYAVCLCLHRLCPAGTMKYAAIAFGAFTLLYEAGAFVHSALHVFVNDRLRMLAVVVVWSGYAGATASVGVAMYRFIVKRKGAVS